MILALIRGAFSSVIWLSRAAGMSTSQSSSSPSRGVLHPLDALRQHQLLHRLLAARKVVPLIHDGLGVEPLGIVDHAVELDQAGDECAHLLEKDGGVGADVAEALDDHPLAGDPLGQAERLHVLPDLADLARHEGHAAAGRLRTAPDSSLGDRLAGHAGRPLQLVVGERRVGVDDPGHLARAGAEVRRRHVDAGADEVLLHQLEGVAAGDPLELVAAELPAVDLDPTLGAAEGSIHHGALVGHQRRERHHLVLADPQAVADATLGGELVVAVLRPPGVDHLDVAVVALQREREVIDAVAVLDGFEQAPGMARERRGAVEVAVDLLEEADVLIRHADGFP